jgi:hypothetical protein
MTTLFPHENGASFSEDRQYRYRLWRSVGTELGWLDDPIALGEHARCVFVGLNPSTADETTNDHTIAKCIGFARAWHFDAIDMVNLFAYAGAGSTDPQSLLDVEDPVGPGNDEALAAAFEGASRIVWCWGQHSRRVAELVSRRMASPGWRALCPKGDAFLKVGTLGRTKSGQPRHPLRLAYSTPFEPLRFRGERLIMADPCP